MMIAVIGGNECDEDIAEIAYQTGREIALKNHILVCGGLGGVMFYASKGAYENKGVVVGILPGGEKKEANPYVTIPIVTAISHARNAIIVRTADGIIAIGGKYGTLSEIGLAFSINKPVVGIKTWDIEGIIKVNSPKQAVEKIEKLCEL